MNPTQALDLVVRANGRFAMVAFWVVVSAYTHFKYFT